MSLIVAGRKPSQIALELGISVRTVGTYRSRILHKMNMRSTAELTTYAIEHSLT